MRINYPFSVICSVLLATGSATAQVTVPVNGNDTTGYYGNIICKTPGQFVVADQLYFKEQSLSRFFRDPFLTVHGNIQYDFLYRSLVDTPFSQKDFRQHTVQATLDITVRNRYPFRIMFTNRRSNSPYFDNITDVNLQFNRDVFFEKLKQKLYKKLPEIPGKDKLDELEKKWANKKAELSGMLARLNNPDQLQKAVEAKEASARRRMAQDTGSAVSGNSFSLPATDMNGWEARGREELNNRAGNLMASADSALSSKTSRKDSLLNNLQQLYGEEREKLDKLLAEVKDLESKISGLKNMVKNGQGRLKQELAQVKDGEQLKEFINRQQLGEKHLPRGWKAISAINNIGIGRTWVDYSELTVKNVSLTGINIEATPSKFYFAFAAGRVNYRFRDFVVRNTSQPKQSLYLVRAGIGKKEGNNVILTWYDGKKSLLNSFGSPGVNTPLERVMGVSLQARLQTDENHYMVLETAKSSFHNTNPGSTTNERLMSKVWNFNTRANEAYSIKVHSFWPQTRSKLTGYYRRMGENFQSFNLQPVNVQQEAYQLSVQQAFWKRRLTVDAGLRKNDFSNPLIYPGISSKTVFKTLQVSLRVPKYPFVSLGYYPSSQLTVLNNNLIAENQYNTFSAVAGYTYRVKNTSLSSNLVYLKFFNTGADTGFIYYNAESYTASQYIFLKNIQLQSGLTITKQRNLNMLTLEQTANIQARKWLSFTAGLKYNRVNREQTLWGGTAGLGLVLGRLGILQAAYDKSYLPGTDRNLLPADMGRLTFYRTF